ncbi:hotdog fold thioesterase [Alicyclobacillaceae bacterium I2511]|nr:hotdog fold thioesterase [Alicyclobacillaceae bacterium I2511]
MNQGSATPEALQGTMMEHLGMQVVRMDKDCVVMTMPVDSRTHQPYGMLHGGASAALAESAASLAGWLNVDQETEAVVGLELNANHIRPKRQGIVTATAIPLHRGQSTMVWEIRITDEANRLVCISRCTLAIVHREATR